MIMVIIDMSLTLSKSELKPNLLRYLRDLEKNKEPIVVTDHGRPIAKIIPYRALEEDSLKALRHSILSYEDPLSPVGEADWALVS